MIEARRPGQGKFIDRIDHPPSVLIVTETFPDLFLAPSQYRCVVSTATRLFNPPLSSSRWALKKRRYTAEWNAHVALVSDICHISPGFRGGHGGTLYAENAEGGGAQFWMRLPASKEVGV